MPALTAEASEQLRLTHAAGCRTIQRVGHTPESVEIAIEVERHRWHWKPKRPKLILVAESHVLTTDQDMAFKTDQSKIRPFLRPEGNLPPDSFVRLVYCLSYGESDLLLHKRDQFSNPGTLAYWDILGRVAFRCPQPRQADGSNFHDRMQWKIDTLRELYRMGIWLLDASVHAIYLRNQRRLPPAVQTELHHQWLGGYGRFLMQICDYPKVWVIGKTVHNCTNNTQLADRNWRGWVYQPSASSVDLNRNWSKLIEDCWQLR